MLDLFIYLRLSSYSKIFPYLPFKKRVVIVWRRNPENLCDDAIRLQHAPRLVNQHLNGCSSGFMKLFCTVAVDLLRPRAVNGSAAARRVGADMCKELKTKVLRLLPPTSNGPTVHQEGQTGELTCTWVSVDCFPNR